MKILLWFAALAVAAVGLALAALHNDGYALIVLPPWRVELSANLVLLLLMVGFLLAYAVLRFIANVLELPGKVRAYRARRIRERGETALRNAVKSLFEGRYSHTIKNAEKAWGDDSDSEIAGLAALLALRSAHALRDEERVELWQSRAEKHDKEIRLARLMTEAEIATETRRFDDARRALERLSSASGGRHIAALRLALRARQSAGEWGEVVRLTRQLEKFKSMTPTQAAPIRLRAYREVLKGLDASELLRYWQGIPASERRESRLALAGARALAAAGDCREAAHIVEESLTAQWEPSLILAYAGCEGGDVLSRIAQAEKWLVQHPNDAGLLFALGCLCRQKQLWGKARHYLEASLAANESSAPSRATHLELARLFDAIEQPEEANRHYRIAALCDDNAR